MSFIYKLGDLTRTAATYATLTKGLYEVREGNPVKLEEVSFGAKVGDEGDVLFRVTIGRPESADTDVKVTAGISRNIPVKGRVLKYPDIIKIEMKTIAGTTSREVLSQIVLSDTTKGS